MSAPHSPFDGTTEAARLMAGLDWSRTPIGSPETWPESLRGQVRTVLSSRYPMLLLWGEQFTQLYNDAYSALIGEQHPAAMGGDVRVTLAEGWPVLGPIIDEAMRTGVASWVPALQLLLERSGYREEAYFSVSHAPARDDEGVTRGVLTVCSEVTEQVVGERRLRLLRELSLQDDPATAVHDVAAQVVAALREHPLDVPFAGLWLREGGLLHLTASTGLALPGTAAVDGDDAWGLAAAGRGSAAEVALPDGADVRGGPFDDPVRTALALPLPGADRSSPLGVLVVGASPARGLDEGYRSFFGLLAQQVAVSLQRARAYEEERARAEALAELDRVKTGFFTGVSHEFRTPLTLMLGPLSDALEDDAAPLPDAQRERVATAVRAAQRLQKLVNDLLTFSGLEAGRAVTTRRTVDLAALTRDTASTFRAAVERAGLRLEVDCPPLERAVAVDPEQWQTVVTNLLSNALKFTFTGGLSVRLAAGADGVRLEVADTGVGIPAEELPRLFERFTRVASTRSRSHEGSGIGLALVRELTALLGGEVRVRSEVGAGSTFEVALPWSALEPPLTEPPLPATVADGAGVRAAVQEALGWLPRDGAPGPEAPAAPVAAGAAGTVLVADDNADVRAYLTRLLQGAGYAVEAVADGRAALDALRRRLPDLLLTDVMMPELDGFELVRAVRADARTATLPVVVLSARAGEEASAEGLETGADDYVVKPFTSSDLLARVRSTLRLARQRSTHVAQLGALADAAAVITSGRRLEDALHVLAGQARALLGAEGVVVALTDPAHPHAAPVQVAAGRTDGEAVGTPLTGRGGRALGSLQAHLAGGVLAPEARALLRPLATVAAAVVEETWHADRDAEVSATLQAALLPGRLPDLPGVALAAAYRPAGADVQVGGDWYDVLPLPDGRVAVSVGDVAGHGLDAALVMGQLRTAARAYALEGLDPPAVVARLDDLAARLPGAMSSTLLLGLLDVGTGALTWCSAGHLPPLLAAPGEEPVWLTGEVTPPLGTGLHLEAVENAAVLPPGGSLVLYTDGLVEDRRDQLETGMPALRARVAAHAGEPAEALLRGVLDGTPEVPQDDTAVLVVQRTGLPAPAAEPVREVVLDLVLPSAPEAAGLLRRRLRPVLAEAGVDDDVAFELLLAGSEAVNNAVEHAVEPTRPEVAVALRVDPATASVRLEVQDFGQWRERRPSMDRGRGSALMSASGEVSVVPNERGTAVVLVRRLG